MVFPAEPTSLPSYCLSWMTFAPAAPKGSHFGEMSQASARMILLHPSFLSLPPPLDPSSAFFILKGHRLEIQVQGKVITFSLQVCLSKNLQLISSWNTGIIPEGNVISRSWARFLLWVSPATFLPCWGQWWRCGWFCSLAPFSATLGELRSNVSFKVTQVVSSEFTWIFSQSSLTPNYTCNNSTM